MLIRFKPKNDHLKCVPLIPATEDLKNIKLARTQVSLLPGTNEVTDDEWKIMKSHLAPEIGRGEIAVIEEAAKAGKSGKASNLKNVKSSRAVALVAECVNPDTLTMWYREETREEVRLVIVEKMKELKIEIPKFTPGEGDGESGDEDGAAEKDLDKMSVEELKVYAADKNITVSGGRAEIIAAIKKAGGK